jgi:Flp pilus assembly protein TadG
MREILISRTWFRLRHSFAGLLRDCSGLAATEFAVITPLMLVMFFGTVEFSSGVAVSRKVTLVARTLSDLTSQSSAPVDDNYLKNVFTASAAILAPYPPSSMTSVTLSEIYVDINQKATIQWSKSASVSDNYPTQATLITSSYKQGDPITVPAGLLVKQTYLILSEVTYVYKPAIGYVMAKAGVTLKDSTYTRPRQSICVIYNNVPAGCPLT